MARPPPPAVDSSEGSATPTTPPAASPQAQGWGAVHPQWLRMSSGETNNFTLWIPSGRQSIAM